MTLYAKAGDRLVVRGHYGGAPIRDAEILEVRHADGTPPYVVRWSDDGHLGFVFPGPDAEVQHFEHPGAGANSPAPEREGGEPDGSAQ